MFCQGRSWRPWRLCQRTRRAAKSLTGASGPDRLDAACRQLGPGARFVGVHELLDLLDERGLRRAVATSTRRARAIAKLNGVSVWPRLQGLVGGDEVARGKPAPDIYLAAARLLQIPIADCLVLEDSNTGVRGGLASGARVIMVPDLLAPAEDVRASGVTVMDSLLRVAEALQLR